MVTHSENEQENQGMQKGDLLPLESDFLANLRAQGKSENTLKNYRIDLACFNKYLVAEGILPRLEAFSVDLFKSYNGHLEQKYPSDNSIRRRIQALRIFFDYLVVNHRYPENPLKIIPSSPKFIDRPRPSNPTEIEKLWGLLTTKQDTVHELELLVRKRNKVMFLLIYLGGLKVSDLEHLKQEHVFLSQDADAPMRVLLSPPKRDPFTVPLPAPFKKIYQEYLKTLKAYHLSHPKTLQFSEVLFSANPFAILGGGLTSRGIETVFEDLRHKAGIEMTAKSLRQSCVMRWLQEGQDEKNIKEWMNVAPSYSLGPYREFMHEHIFQITESFLRA